MKCGFELAIFCLPGENLTSVPRKKDCEHSLKQLIIKIACSILTQFWAFKSAAIYLFIYFDSCTCSPLQKKKKNHKLQALDFKRSHSKLSVDSIKFNWGDLNLHSLHMKLDWLQLLLMIPFLNVFAKVKMAVVLRRRVCSIFYGE
mgnify:CR=1 FL=1